MSVDNILRKEINLLTNLITNFNGVHKFTGSKPYFPPGYYHPSRTFKKRKHPYRSCNFTSFPRHPSLKNYSSSFPKKRFDSRYQFVISGKETIIKRNPHSPKKQSVFGPSNKYKLNRKDTRKIASNRERLKINNFKMQLVKLRGKIYEVNHKKIPLGEKNVLSLKKPSKWNNISLASRMVTRSKMVLAKKHTTESCMFYNRYGRCGRGEKCKYVHDPAKVAVCRKFLKGTCPLTDDLCPLSHVVCPAKMPVCHFFLKGRCAKSTCPYSHVCADPKAPLCQDFLKGFCPNHEKCKKRHEFPKRNASTIWKPLKSQKKDEVSITKSIDMAEIKFPCSLPSFIPLIDSRSKQNQKSVKDIEVCDNLKIRPNFLLPQGR